MHPLAFQFPPFLDRISPDLRRIFLGPDKPMCNLADAQLDSPTVINSRVLIVGCNWRSASAAIKAIKVGGAKQVVMLCRGMLQKKNTDVTYGTGTSGGVKSSRAGPDRVNLWHCRSRLDRSLDPSPVFFFSLSLSPSLPLPASPHRLARPCFSFPLFQALRSRPPLQSPFQGLPLS